MLDTIVKNLEELDAVYLEIGGVGEDSPELSSYVTNLWINEFQKLTKALEKLSDTDENSLEFLTQVMNLESGVKNFVQDKEQFMEALKTHDFSKDNLKSIDSQNILMKNKSNMIELVDSTLNNMIEELNKDDSLFGLIEFSDFLTELLKIMWVSDINEFFSGMIVIWYFNNNLF